MAKINPKLILELIESGMSRRQSVPVDMSAPTLSAK